MTSSTIAGMGGAAGGRQRASAKPPLYDIHFLDWDGGRCSAFLQRTNEYDIELTRIPSPVVPPQNAKK